MHQLNVRNAQFNVSNAQFNVRTYQFSVLNSGSAILPILLDCHKFYLHNILFPRKICKFSPSIMSPKSNQRDSSKSTLVSESNSPLKKSGRKVLAGQKLPFSPKTKVPTINKVFVLGTHLGIVLIRTQRQNSNDDAFTQDAIKMIEDETSGVAATLNIIKICSRRQSQLIDRAIMQRSDYPSRWFVTIVPEEKNTPQFRQQHVEKFIKFLNGIEWKYPQQFLYQCDETRMTDNNFSNSLDMFLLNCDIVVLLKVYLFEKFEDFLADEDAVLGVLGSEGTSEQANQMFQELWRDL